MSGLRYSGEKNETNPAMAPLVAPIQHLAGSGHAVPSKLGIRRQK